jgi:hypothetical protein
MTVMLLLEVNGKGDLLQNLARMNARAIQTKALQVSVGGATRQLLFPHLQDNDQRGGDS